MTAPGASQSVACVQVEEGGSFNRQLAEDHGVVSRHTSYFRVDVSGASVTCKQIALSLSSPMIPCAASSSDHSWMEFSRVDAVRMTVALDPVSSVRLLAGVRRCDRLLPVSLVIDKSEKFSPSVVETGLWGGSRGFRLGERHAK